MPDNALQIEAIRTQTLKQIADITASPKPTYEVDGQRIDWRAYLDSLRQTIDWCDRQLVDTTPYEVRSQGACHER